MKNGRILPVVLLMGLLVNPVFSQVRENIDSAKEKLQHINRGFRNPLAFSSIQPSALIKNSPFYDAISFVVESGSVAFQKLKPGQNVDILSAITIRVYSRRNWELKLLTYSSLQATDHGERVPASRLKVKSRETGEYVSFEEGHPIMIARGPATSDAGFLVITNLRLRLDANDPLGSYVSNLRVLLEEQ